MAGAMLMLLAACRVRSLANLIGTEVMGAGEHLRVLLSGWRDYIGGVPSPSVEQSLTLIADIDRLIRPTYKPPAS
jgi:hypothetical protein